MTGDRPLDEPGPFRLYPHEVPDLSGLRTDEDFRRAAGRVAPVVMERVAAAEAARAWADRVREVRRNGGRPSLPEAERRTFLGRAVARALADADGMGRLAARIEGELRALARRPAVGDSSPGGRRRRPSPPRRGRTEGSRREERAAWRSPVWCGA